MRHALSERDPTYVEFHQSFCDSLSLAEKKSVNAFEYSVGFTRGLIEDEDMCIRVIAALCEELMKMAPNSVIST